MILSPRWRFSLLFENRRSMIDTPFEGERINPSPVPIRLSYFVNHPKKVFFSKSHLNCHRLLSSIYAICFHFFPSQHLICILLLSCFNLTLLVSCFLPLFLDSIFHLFIQDCLTMLLKVLLQDIVIKATRRSPWRDPYVLDCPKIQ